MELELESVAGIGVECLEFCNDKQFSDSSADVV